MEAEERTIPEELLPDPEDPGFLGHKFFVTVYRTCRIVLGSKRLLGPGRSLNETLVERVNNDLFTMRAKIDFGSLLGAISDEAGHLPTLPSDELTDEENHQIATAHGYAALQAGYEPNDPCLHWFGKELFTAFCPSPEALLEFENRLLDHIGPVLLQDGKRRAIEDLSQILGYPCHSERKDWIGLGQAYARDFAATTTEDDRTVAIMRFEEVRQKAVNALDLRAELAAGKAIAAVQGLTFQDQDKLQRDLLLLLNEPHERSSQRALPHAERARPSLLA